MLRRSGIGLVIPIAAATMAFSTPASALCKGLVCAEGTDNGTNGFKRVATVRVHLKTTFMGATHYNITVPCRSDMECVNRGRQFENKLGAFTFKVTRPGKYEYFVQACKSGSMFSSSICTPRPAARFTHTVDK